MTISQEEWDRRQAAGNWTQLPPQEPAPKTRPSYPWVDEAIDSIASNGNGQEGRHVAVTRAGDIDPKRVRWAWQDRIPIGTIALLAGPEGLGKSTLGYWLAAQLSRGQLPGEHHGTPRATLVCATEDSWAHTIVPRLMAHGADLNLVYRTEVHDDNEHTDLGLSLPVDLAELEHVAATVDAALLILDPLMSRLASNLDTHKDGEVRRALEPLSSFAETTRLAVLGLIHHNKSGSTNPLDVIMASKAFTAVARSVHTVIRDPDDDTGLQRFFGTSKSNLGRLDLPTLTFTIHGWHYDTDDGPGVTGQIHWGAELTESIADALQRATATPEEKTALEEACEWLEDYLEEHGGRAIAGQLQAAARTSGHNERTLRRARKALKVGKSKCGFQGAWEWYLPQPAKPDTNPQDPPVVPLSPLPSTSDQRGQIVQRGQQGVSPRARGPFGEHEINEPIADPPTEPPWELTRTCSCGAEATDISGLCHGCITNPGTPHPPDTLDF